MKDKKNTGKQTQATWGGRFSQAPSRLMLEFGESVSFDSALAEFDIQGSIAHAHMLADVGIIEKSEYSQIKAGLEKILKLIRAGEFEWKTELEDVHMNIEQALTSMVPCAAKLHSSTFPSGLGITSGSARAP